MSVPARIARFIRLTGDTWVNPRHVTSVGIVPNGNKFNVEVKLVTQQARLKGSIFYGSGHLDAAQKRCCYEIEFLSKSQAQKWLEQKFGDYIN